MQIYMGEIYCNKNVSFSKDIFWHNVTFSLYKRKSKNLFFVVVRLFLISHFSLSFFNIFLVSLYVKQFLSDLQHQVYHEMFLVKKPFEFCYVPLLRADGFSLKQCKWEHLNPWLATRYALYLNCSMQVVATLCKDLFFLSFENKTNNALCSCRVSHFTAVRFFSIKIMTSLKDCPFSFVQRKCARMRNKEFTVFQ